MDLHFLCSDADHWGCSLEQGLEVGLVVKNLVAGPASMEPGQDQPKVATWVHLPMGSAPVGEAKGVGWFVRWAVAKDSFKECLRMW